MLTIADAIKHLDRFIESPDGAVFQIVGPTGIGKRTAVRKLLQDRNIKAVEHQYTIVESATPLKRSIEAHNHSIHFWGDLSRSNLVDSGALYMLKEVEEKPRWFCGKFILTMDDTERQDEQYYDLPGVAIEMTNEDILSWIEETFVYD